MPAFTIKNIPDDVFDRLKQQAAANQRSINQEAIFCLRIALTRPQRTAEDARALLTAIDRDV